MSFREDLIHIKETGATVLVVGLGISGVATAEFLNGVGIKTVCVEREAEAAYRGKSKFVSKVDQLIASGVDINFSVDGEQVNKFLKDVKLCVVSPGVSL